MDRVLSLIKAVWSVVRYGDAPFRLYAERQAACVLCSHFERSLYGCFCGACDCPRNYVSDLRTKWRMPDIKCPKGKW